MWWIWPIIVGFALAWAEVHTIYGPLRRVPKKQVHPPFRFNDQPMFLRIIQCAFGGWCATLVLWGFLAS